MKAIRLIRRTIFDSFSTWTADDLNIYYRKKENVYSIRYSLRCFSPISAKSSWRIILIYLYTKYSRYRFLSFLFFRQDVEVKSYFAFVVFCSFVIPLVITTVCFIRIIMELRKSALETKRKYGKAVSNLIKSATSPSARSVRGLDEKNNFL